MRIRQFCSWRSGCRPTGDRPRRNSPFRERNLPCPVCCAKRQHRCSRPHRPEPSCARRPPAVSPDATFRPHRHRRFPASFRMRPRGAAGSALPSVVSGDCVGREWVANTQVIDIPCRDRPDWQAFCSCGNAATEKTACGSRTSRQLWELWSTHPATSLRRTTGQKYLFEPNPGGYETVASSASPSLFAPGVQGSETNAGAGALNTISRLARSPKGVEGQQVDRQPTRV